MSKYGEVRYSCLPEHVSIDAWLTANDAEEGVVIARIDNNTKHVDYVDDDARYDDYAQEVITEAIKVFQTQEYTNKLYKRLRNSLDWSFQEEFYQNQDISSQYFLYDYENETFSRKSSFRLISEYIIEHFPDKIPESVCPRGDNDNSGYYVVRVDIEESDEWLQFCMYKKDARWNLEFLGLHEGEE